MTQDIYKIGLKKYLKLQVLEVEEHKWYLSEQRTQDVGWNYAFTDFIQQGLAEKFRSNYLKNICRITDANKVGELERILIDHDTNTLHDLLGD